MTTVAGSREPNRARLEELFGRIALAFVDAYEQLTSREQPVVRFVGRTA
jgi:hypothetical protein